MGVVEIVILGLVLLLLFWSMWVVPQWQQDVYPPTILLRGDPIALILRDMDPDALRAFLKTKSRPLERAWESCGGEAPAELRIGKDHYALNEHGWVAVTNRRWVEFDGAKSMLELLADTRATRNELAERAQELLKQWMWKSKKGERKS
jgi:hypothetical protein